MDDDTIDTLFLHLQLLLRLLCRLFGFVCVFVVYGCVYLDFRPLPHALQIAMWLLALLLLWLLQLLWMIPFYFMCFTLIMGYVFWSDRRKNLVAS
jgi:hypothetical protein